MKQVTVNVEDNKYEIFLELIGSLDYVRVESEEEEILRGLLESFQEVKLMQEGKLPKLTMKDLLDEL